MKQLSNYEKKKRKVDKASPIIHMACSIKSDPVFYALKFKVEPTRLFQQ